MSTGPVVVTSTGLTITVAEGRTTTYAVDHDLRVSLASGGHRTSSCTQSSVVLLELGVDGEASDDVNFSTGGGQSDLETVEQAIAALKVVRKALDVGRQRWRAGWNEGREAERALSALDRAAKA